MLWRPLSLTSQTPRRQWRLKRAGASPIDAALQEGRSRCADSADRLSRCPALAWAPEPQMAPATLPGERVGLTPNVSIGPLRISWVKYQT